MRYYHEERPIRWREFLSVHTTFYRRVQHCHESEQPDTSANNRSVPWRQALFEGFTSRQQASDCDRSKLDDIISLYFQDEDHLSIVVSQR
jgi:hypothetical protein